MDFEPMVNYIVNQFNVISMQATLSNNYNNLRERVERPPPFL